MISTVLLDVDNTLLDFNACALASMQDAFHTFDLPFSKEVVFPTFLRINDQLWAQIEEGNLTKGEHYRIRWNLILKELGICFDGIRLEDQFVEGLHHYAVPIQGALELVSYLSKKYMVCTASNAPCSQQKQRLKTAGLFSYFDRFYFSEAIGHQKPSKDFFAFCLKDLRIQDPEKVVMIGDSYKADIQGANSCGIKTIWYDAKGSNRVDTSCSDHIVHSLLEIKNFL